MRVITCIVALGMCCGAAGLLGCKTTPAMGDASTTSTTSSEQTLEPIADGGAAVEVLLPKPPPEATPQVSAAADAGLPSWVPKDATLSIISASDHDRNLGIVTSPPTAVTVDAGSCEVGIQLRTKP